MSAVESGMGKRTPVCVSLDRLPSVTPGNVPDIHMAIPLPEGLPRPKRLIADKAYDAMTLRRWLMRRRIRAVIPSLATRTFPFPMDCKAYKRRHVIERLWGRCLVPPKP